MQSFCDFSAGILAGISAAAAEANHGALARKAHSLKGSSATVGAARVAALAARLETAALGEDHLLALQLAGELAPCTQTAMALFHQQLANSDCKSRLWQSLPEPGTGGGPAAHQGNSPSRCSTSEIPSAVFHSF